MKKTVRGAALDTLSFFWGLTGKTEKGLKKNRVQFIYLHHIFENEEQDFRRLLAHLSKGHVFIPYFEAAARIVEGRIDAPYLAVSFDDGIRNNLKAAQIMEEFGIRACFFVCPSIVGETDPVKITKFCKEKMHKPPLEFLDWKDIELLLSKGHEIGSHTMTHSNLAALSGDERLHEIKGSFDILKSRIGKIEHFSWPYGEFRHFSKKAAAAVFDSGYKTCASAERGCHVSKAESLKELCIRRDHVMPGWPVRHVDYFMAKNSAASTRETNYFEY